MTEAERLRKMAERLTNIAAKPTINASGVCLCGAASWSPACPPCLRLAATACVRLAEQIENGVTR